jgi:hypothetical protein
LVVLARLVKHLAVLRAKMAWGIAGKSAEPVGSGAGQLAMGVLVVGILASMRVIAALTITSMAVVLVDARTVAAVVFIRVTPDSVFDILS